MEAFTNSFCKQIRNRLCMDAWAIVMIYKIAICWLKSSLFSKFGGTICVHKCISSIYSPRMVLLHVFTYLLWFFHWLVKICISILYIDGRCNLRFNFECEMPIYKCIRFMVTFRCTKMCVRMWMCVKALIQHTFSFAKHCDCYENLKFGVEYIWKP